MKPARKTLRRPDELVAAGLIANARRGESTSGSPPVRITSQIWEWARM